MMKYRVTLLALCLCMFGFISCGNPGTDKDKGDNPNGTVLNPDSLDTNGTPADSSLIMVMDNMIDQMRRMSIAEHFDVHFSKLMIIHHQGAIDMAEIEIESGKDEKLKTIARELIAKRRGVIEVLQENVSHHKPKPADNVTDEELKESIDKMMTGMKGIRIRGNTDREFAQMMLLHLDCSIEMAAQEVIQGHHVQLKLMARDMIKEFNKEKAKFQEWLASH